MIKVCGGVHLIRWWYLINVTAVCAKQCVCHSFHIFLHMRARPSECVCWVNYSQLPLSREPVCTEQPYLCTTYPRLIAHTDKDRKMTALFIIHSVFPPAFLFPPSLTAMTNNTNMARYALQLTDWNTACYCNPLMYSFSLVSLTRFCPEIRHHWFVATKRHCHSLKMLIL